MNDPMLLAVISDEAPNHEQTVRVRDTWARIAVPGMLCPCGNPVTVACVREIAGLDPEITVHCGDCSPVVFMTPAGLCWPS